MFIITFFINPQYLYKKKKMKRNINTLNEEIERMKSLFTEERMFGNLITEDVSGNPVEDYSNILKYLTNIILLKLKML